MLPTRSGFRIFTRAQGYANAPLDGIWLRAPYLHNGSVPNLTGIAGAVVDAVEGRLFPWQ